MIERAVVKQILERDPAWAAYALADLQPGFAEQCTWFVHADAGLVMLYAGLEPPILFAMGPEAAVAEALVQAADARQLPGEVYLSVRPEHAAAVGRWYDLSPAWDDRRPMLRMALNGAAPRVAAASAAVLEDASRSEPSAADPAATKNAVRLSAADAPRLAALYVQGGEFAPDAFATGQIDNGVFYGIVDGDGALLAAGGTHIVNRQAGVAAIGNFCTLPAARGKGYASALLAAIVSDLRAGGVATIVLNVDQRNAIAQRLYARHGFVEHCTFIEGSVRQRAG